MYDNYIGHMVEHWTTRLRLTASKPLIEGWRQLEQAIEQVGSGAPHWIVTQQPTGSGKTEALKVLAAVRSVSHAPGILIVTRFRQEANELADGINRIAAAPVARAVHGAAPADGADLSLYPVLIITHSAYKRALIELADQGQSPNWDRYRTFHHGERRWLIVDEAFEWVDAYDLNLSLLRRMLGDLLGVTEDETRADIGRLLALAVALTGNSTEDRKLQPLTTKQFSVLAQTDWSGIFGAVHALDNDAIARAMNCPKPDNSTDRKSSYQTKTEYVALLKQLQTVTRIGWAWRSRRGGRALLHSSRSLLGIDGRRGIILDATAGADIMYTVMGDLVCVLPRPTGIRRYDNVTLHTSHGHKVGKEHLLTASSGEWPVLWGQLAERLTGQDVLVCAHKDVLPILKDYPVNGCEPLFAHWGNIDGKNKWSHCTAVVLFGLPYLDEVAPAHWFFAFHGPPNAEWFAGNRSFGKHADIRTALTNSFIAKSVVQAVNRTACRRAVDASGNCPNTDLFLLLPNGATGAQVQQTLTEQMPGLRTKSWEAGAAKRKARKVPTEAKLLAYFCDAEPGLYRRSEVARDLSIRGNSLERLVSKLRTHNSELANNLTVLGVQYISTTGRGREAYFTKH